MKVVAKECVEGITVLMNHPIGSKILKRVSFRLTELHMKTENAEFLEKLAENISVITDYGLFKELVNHILLSMMIPNCPVAHKNLLVLSEKAPPHLLCSFISQMNIETLMEFACHKCNYFLKGVIGLHSSASTCLVERLRGSFFTLSRHCNGNYLVKECLENGSEANCSSVISEISFGYDFLMTHSYGNYVVQKAMRRLKKMDMELYNNLKQKILTRKRELNNNRWGKEVVKTLFYCEK